MKSKELTLRELRLAAGVTQIQAAVYSGTSEPTVRLYEASPVAVAHPEKRRALDVLYAEFAATVARNGEVVKRAFKSK